MLVAPASLAALADTITDATEARPVAVRDWCLRQSSPIEVLDEGFEIFQGAGLVVVYGRLSYAEGIGYPDGSRSYGASVEIPDLGDGCDCHDSVIIGGICEDCGGVA